MKKITYLETGISIIASLMDDVNNNIIYRIEIPLEQMPTAIEILPQVNGSPLQGDIFLYQSETKCADMQNIQNTMQIETSDVGKTINEAKNIWLTNIIYQMNLLNLDLTKWTLTNE